MYKVLIVDDTEIVRIEMKRLKIWEKAGFIIAAEAKNGQEALKKLAKERFDMVITDIQMPVLNGLELLEEIKKKKLCSCTALLSAHNDFSYAKKGIGLGAFDYLLKPVNEEELVQLLGKASEFLARGKEEEARENSLRESLGDKLDHEFLSTAAREISRKISGFEGGVKESTEEVAEAIFSACGGNSELSMAVMNHFLEELGTFMEGPQPWLKKLGRKTSEPTGELAHKTLVDQKVWLSDRVLILSERIKGYTFCTDNETLRKVCSFILCNVDEELTVKQVATRLNFNRDYLSRFFKEASGQTMTDYINRVKTDRARVLLETGNYKIYEVSELLGYKAVEHFSRLFRQYQGIYPKNVLKGNPAE